MFIMLSHQVCDHLLQQLQEIDKDTKVNRPQTMCLQLVTGRANIQTQLCLTPVPKLLILCLLSSPNREGRQ